MALNKVTKINQILKNTPKGVVLTTSWLTEQNVSSQLMSEYVKSQWFDYIAKGAYIRSGDNVDINGAIYALQSQLGLSFHFGAASALAYQNISHFIRVNSEVLLFGAKEETVPAWFRKYFSNYKLFKTNFLPKNIGLVDYDTGNFAIQISSPERAILEVLYLCPGKASLKEAYQLMELLINIRPSLMQELLEECNSFKVKRLFLFMAEKINHDWFEYLDTGKIDIGKGKRVISKNGKLDKKYNIVIESLKEI